jgi:hypothetical protein
VHLAIELQPGKGMQVRAEVAWVRGISPDGPPGVGLRFVEMHPQHRAWLETAVRKYAAEHAAPVHLSPSPQLRAAQGPHGLADAQMSLQSDASLDAATVVLGIDLGTSNCCACVMPFQFLTVSSAFLERT